MRYLFLLLLSSCTFSSKNPDYYIKLKLSSGEIVECRGFIKDECGAYMYACGDSLSNEYKCQKDYKIISWRIAR
jgi:hypothetical protein